MRKRGIKYLRRLVEVYRRFTNWKGVSVIEDGGEIYVVWHTPKKKKDSSGEYVRFDFTMRTFPRSEIPKRITSYREKIKREFAKRNN